MLLLHDQMNGIGGRNAVNACIPKSAQIKASEQIFTGAEKDWRDSKMHVIDQASAQVLLNRRDSAADR